MHKIFLSGVDQINSCFCCNLAALSDKLSEKNFKAIIPTELDRVLAIQNFSENNELILASDFVLAYFDPSKIESVWEILFAIENDISVFLFNFDISECQTSVKDPFLLKILKSIPVYSSAEEAFCKLQVEFQNRMINELAKAEAVILEKENLESNCSVFIPNEKFAKEILDSQNFIKDFPSIQAKFI